MDLKYVVETKKFANLKNKIEIPRFQRGLRWSLEKKKAFIKTLKLGLPVGTLLLYPIEGEKEKYLIVDGLQRYTTMLQYTKDYYMYVEQDEFSDSDLMSIILSSKDAKDIYDKFQPKDQVRVLDKMREIIAANIKSRKADDNFFLITNRTTDSLCKEISILPKEDSLQISNAVYKIIEQNDKNGTNYDVEHCVPKAVIKQYFLEKDIVVPMSSVCNLTYIPEGDNRSKGEDTYYQRQQKAPETYTLNQQQLDDLVYPRREELSFVESTDTLTEDAYDTFLKNRKLIILKTMMDRLYKS